MYNMKAMFSKVFFFLLTSFYDLIKKHKANFVKTHLSFFLIMEFHSD